MERGLFITFEGIDGCGKSTQLELVKAKLTELGKEFIVVREPGGTVVGEKIRGILLDKKNDSMVPLAELLLYEAARAQITEEVIKPSLEKGITVICDRFYDSTTAYQGYARALGTELTDIREETDIINQIFFNDAPTAEIYTTFFKGRAGPTEKGTDKE